MGTQSEQRERDAGAGKLLVIACRVSSQITMPAFVLIPTVVFAMKWQYNNILRAML